MNAPDFGAVAAAFADDRLAATIKRADDNLMRSNCMLVGSRDSRATVLLVAAAINTLETLTSPEVIYLVQVLANKVREAESVYYSDAIADAMEVELPNAVWAMSEDNPDNYPEEA